MGNKETQKSGDNSTNIKTNGDVSVTNHYGLSYEDTKEVIADTVRAEMRKYGEKARGIMGPRKSGLLESLYDGLTSLTDEEKKAIEEPDVLLALVDALKAACRQKDIDTRKTLANLVIKRIKAESNKTIKGIVYNEAITTVNKLSLDQLKILSLSYILNRTMNEHILSWENFDEYLNNKIIPFLNFTDTITQYQHIEYAGCGRVESFVGNMSTRNLRENYSFLFMDKINADEIKNIFDVYTIHVYSSQPDHDIVKNAVSNTVFLYKKNDNQLEFIIKSDDSTLKNIEITDFTTLEKINGIMNSSVTRNNQICLTAPKMQELKRVLQNDLVYMNNSTYEMRHIQPLLAYDKKNDNYVIKAINKKALEEFLNKSPISGIVKNKFVSLYASKIISEKDVIKRITEKTKSGKLLCDVLSRSQIGKLQLTSVGLAIGATYYEQVTGDKLNIDIWIN